MSSFLIVMKAELVRSFIIMRRYWFRTVTGLAIGYGMLLFLAMLILSGEADVSDALNRNFESPDTAMKYVLGFIIGMYAFGVVGTFTQGLQGMARTGVLEQLCMSPHGLITNFLARSFVGSISTVLSSSFMVWLVSKSVGGSLHFSFLPVFVILGLTFVNLLGFGFMMGGLVLVFKQVGQVAILIRMVLFGLAVYVTEDALHQGAVMSFVMHALPITDATVCLKYVLIKGQGTIDGAFVSVFSKPSFYYLLVSCVVWTTLGVACFKSMENWSRAKGTLGAY